MWEEVGVISPCDTPDDRRLLPPAKPRHSGVSATRVSSRSVRFARTNQSDLTVETREKPASEEEDNDSGRTTGYSRNRDVRSKAANQRRGLPSFGAMLPVRLTDTIYALRANSIVRLELTRYLKRITSWRGEDRAYIQIKGYIAPETDRLVKRGGEMLGYDVDARLRGFRRIQEDSAMQNSSPHKLEDSLCVENPSAVMLKLKAPRF